jgi:hypothetical protein
MNRRFLLSSNCPYHLSSSLSAQRTQDSLQATSARCGKKPFKMEKVACMAGEWHSLSELASIF